MFAATRLIINSIFRGHENKTRLENTIDFSDGCFAHIIGERRPLTAALRNEGPSIFQLLRAYFAPSIDHSVKEYVPREFETFIEGTAKPDPNFQDATYGWSIETDVPVSGEPGKTGIMFVAFIRWSTVDVARTFDKDAKFMDGLRRIRNHQSLVKLDTIIMSSTVRLK